MTATVPPSTGADPSATDTRHRKLAIIGSGPAGLTAAIYAGRANLEPIVLAGNVPMGQLMITSDVENYPGFPKGIMGPELMQLFREQAERFGSTIVERDVTRVDFSERPFRLWVGDDEYRADAVIVATGASALWLGLPTEEEFRDAACPPAPPATASSSAAATSPWWAAATPRSRRRPSSPGSRTR